ncbi:Glucans biosynthesis glucosyltransferase H [Novipirellula aureliae]|uniref:Glucans biosynthesis glucosyltransferase H n=1 Tax=Novipirellula aureliae TaxID=2527966 RepID=A0A5C6DXP6_9BACT|nr:glucans biosynthesis glucosyltransferase MdoH [Novipirellula aureliae]TWU41460.1 Glucans biosynthesis glucosyltransferase H [Novipirellula aureliae]
MKTTTTGLSFHRRMRAIRALVALATLLMTLLASSSYIAVASNGAGINIIEWMSVPLFAILFGWIAFSFWLATLGFVVASRERRQEGRGQEVWQTKESKGAVVSSKRTAVLMPIYNESPTRVFAGVKAMMLEWKHRNLAEQFDFYILSDTTDHEVWLEEEAAWSKLTESLGSSDHLYYRHRPANTARKAGNIADFVQRWGAHHDYMIILDADSLVSATTMSAMVERMDGDERLGILQIPPVPIGRMSLFARIQQFSASVYGPIFVKGFSAWAGNEGNYWGHNAIIRVEAFRRHCNLPILPGKPPLGGEILSHDFVEAALLVRAGWKVQVATDIGGSYEECPTTLADYAQRDQRWCQGNLQHAKLLLAENFNSLSRLHFGCGVMAYSASPIWVLFTLFCMVGMAIDSYTNRPMASSGMGPGALMIFIAAMLLLLLPKAWGVLLIGGNREQTRRHGGYIRLWVSAIVETACSVLLSPIMAIFHTRFVIAVLRGANVHWSAQQRDERGVRWGEAFQQFYAITFGGVVATVLIALFLPRLLAWFSPLLAGVLLSIPIAVAMGSQRLGRWLHNRGLLLVPAETHPPIICVYHQHALSESINDSGDSPRRSWFEQVLSDPKAFARHIHVQQITSSDTKLPLHQAKAIEATFADGGANAIPKELLYGLLLDSELLKKLHIESQMPNFS